MNSIFGPAKAWFVSLPTFSPASDPEPAASGSDDSTSGHSHGTANGASSSSPNGTRPDDESSSDDDCFITAIHDGMRQNPVQEIPKTEKVEGKEGFGGRFESILAARAKEVKGTEDSGHATGSLLADFTTSSAKSDKPAPSNTENNSYNGISKPKASGSNKEEVNGSEGDVNLSISQSANPTNRNGAPIARHSRETPSIAEAGSSKRPLDVEDIEAWSRNGSVDSAKRRRLSIEPNFLSKDQLQHLKGYSGATHSRIRARWRPPSRDFGSLARPGSNLDEAKSKEIAKSIRNTPTRAGVKATEKIQQIKERAKEAEAPKRTEEQVLREFTKAPIESIFGGKPASNPTDTIVASRSQPTKDARGTQGDKNPASSQPATHRTAQATQPSLPNKKPSQPGDTITVEDHFKHINDKYPKRKPTKFVDYLPDGLNEERTGHKFTVPSTLASSSKNPPTPRTNINSGPKALPLALPPPHHLPAAPLAPEPAPVAAIPPPPPKKVAPAQSLLSPTDVILQYVIKQTKKHTISKSDSIRHYRSKTVYTSKKEANETCRRRVLNLLKEDIPFQTVDQRYVGEHLFKGTIFYEDGEVQFYYVHEEATMLGDVVEKRELWVDEEGMGIYAKRMWAVWAVRYYPSEEEETKMEQVVLGSEQVVLGSGVGMGGGNGRVEVVDEGDEGDDEDDGEEEEDLFGYKDVDGQLNEVVTPTTSEDLADSGSQTNMNDSQTEGHQTQTQTELELQTQQEITSDGQSQSIQTLSDKQTQPTIQTHQRLEGHSDAQPEPKSQTESVTQPQPEPYAPPDTTQQAQPQPPSQSLPTNPARPPKPPLPCTLYSPPPPSTIYSSSSESDSEGISRTRNLPNNIPPPPPPLPSPSLLTPDTTLHGTFTTLSHASLEVLEVFKALTKPETPARMSDVLYWREEVVPEAEARFKEWSKDGQDDNGEKDNEGGEGNDGDYGNGIEERPFNLEWEPDAQLFKWRFTRVKVWVQELKLEGPKDLGGLEVKMPSGNAGVSGPSGTGSVAGPSTSNGNAGVGPASTSTSGAAKAKGAGTVKVKATASRTASRTDNELANQHTYYKNAREVLAAKAKAKKRRRPTRQEKGKGKAVDPVAHEEGNGKGTEQVNLKEWEDELGGIEEGDLSEEE